jgi:hypothetical protein
VRADASGASGAMAQWGMPWWRKDSGASQWGIRSRLRRCGVWGRECPGVQPPRAIVCPPLCGLTRAGWRGVGKPWRRKKLRHYSAERTVPRTAADAAGHVISPRCGPVVVGRWMFLWLRWLCRPCHRLPYLRRQGGLLPPPRGVSGVSVTVKPTRDKRWVCNPQGVGGVGRRCVQWLRTTDLRWSTRRGCTQ